MTTLPLSFQKRRVLVDSSAYLALIDEDDKNHKVAISIMRSLISQRYKQFITNYMLVEAHALILSALGYRHSTPFLKSILTGKTVIVRARSSDEEKARGILFKYTDKEFSYNDVISFVVMERLGIDLAFTFDKDFSQYGLTVLSPELLK